MKNARYFSSNNADYATYRPTYPTELAERLAKISPSLDCALDIGCGTGQLSVLLGEYFKKVVATDASKVQIEQARSHKNVIYYCTSAENSNLPTNSVDLITVAQASHWFNLDRFYAEVRRIAKYKAVIALITYGVLEVENDKINQIIAEFYHKTIAPFWPPERRHVDEKYQNLNFPFPKIAFPELQIERNWILTELLGYIGTWSAVKIATKQMKTNPMDILSEKLKKYWTDNEKMKITWDLTVIVGRVNTV